MCAPQNAGLIGDKNSGRRVAMEQHIGTVHFFLQLTKQATGYLVRRKRRKEAEAEVREKGGVQAVTIPERRVREKTVYLTDDELDVLCRDDCPEAVETKIIKHAVARRRKQQAA
jgi:hypothetical protein